MAEKTVKPNKTTYKGYTDFVDESYDIEAAAVKVAKKWSGGSSSSSTSYSGGSTYSYKKCSHPGKAIKVGKYENLLYLGARWDLDKKVVRQMGLICPLNGEAPKMDKDDFGIILPIACCELTDRGGVPKNWKSFLLGVISVMEKGHKVLGYCTGGHGRTGTFAASLIALLEPETTDPIAAARERHCHEAVESEAQARAIFALRNEELPDKYVTEFCKSKSYNSSNVGYGSYYSHHGGVSSYETSHAATVSVNPGDKELTNRADGCNFVSKSTDGTGFCSRCLSRHAIGKPVKGSSAAIM